MRSADMQNLFGSPPDSTARANFESDLQVVVKVVLVALRPAVAGEREDHPAAILLIDPALALLV